MRLGLTLPVRGLSVPATLELARHARARGFEEIWTGEVNGIDALPLVAALADEPGLRFGSGIMSVFRWTPIGMASAACSLHDLTDGRFSLGIGSSSARMVNAWTGLVHATPFDRLRAYVEVMRAVFAGVPASVDRASLQIRRLTIAPEQPRPVPILLAAMGAKSVELAAEIADGAVLNLLDRATLADTVARLHDATAGREYQTVFRVLSPAESSAATIDQMASHLQTYGRIPGYASSFARQGISLPGAEDRAAREELVRELVLIPDEPVVAHLRAWQDCGLDTLVLAPSSTFAKEAARQQSIALLLDRVAGAAAELTLSTGSAG
jgi:alkanesulfonate monooxygenase SsuD/methylene tetrahydromethanopterin reductase-like flavin-dependent oxidoreductase (luciferase family)